MTLRPLPELHPRAWVFDEGDADPLFGGNKVRKLREILPEALQAGATDLVTLGAIGSHHVLATALHGARAGLRTHAILVPQPDDPHVAAILAASLAACATVTRCRDAAVPWAVARRLAALRAEGRRPWFVPVGGSSAAGVRGWVAAGRELRAAGLPEPVRVVVALGSGGTAAGLLVGLGAGAEVVAVRVAPTWLANRLRVGALARRAGGAEARLRLVHTWYGGGYGVSDPRVEAALARGRELGLPLERTYTAKALGAALELVRDEAAGTTVFLQSAPLSPPSTAP